MRIQWQRRRRRAQFSLIQNPFWTVCWGSVAFFLIFLLLKSCLPETPSERSTNGRLLLSGSYCLQLSQGSSLGEFGDMMIAMLPDDLPFTVFVPSVESFRQVLKLNTENSKRAETANNTRAIISRLLGFSAIPEHLPSSSVPARQEIVTDSFSGFRLYVRKDADGSLSVNGVRSECMDVRKGAAVVHVMRGALMDAEFEQSFASD